MTEDDEKQPDRLTFTFTRGQVTAIVATVIAAIVLTVGVLVATSGDDTSESAVGPVATDSLDAYPTDYVPPPTANATSEGAVAPTEEDPTPVEIDDDTADFVKEINKHAQAVANDVELVLQKVLASDASGDYFNVASNAETLHENMQQFREELFGAIDSGNDDHLALMKAENDLKAGIGTIIRWTDDPSSPSLSARWAREIGQGAGAWNALVKKLWTAAGVTPIPTITIPSA